MAMMVSPEVAKLFQVLTGEEWPDANEDQLRALAAEWAAGAQALGSQLGPGLRAAVQAIRSEWAGEAERAFAARVSPFIEGDNYIDAAAQLFQSLADYLLKLAQDVEYMKLVSIYSLIALLAEIALAIAMSPFTGGASMAWLAARMAVVRFLLQSLLGRLLIQLLQAAVFGIAFQLLIDAAAQATQFAMGTRTEWDTDKTKNAAGVGAMGAALAPFMGGLGKVLSSGLTKFLNTYFSKLWGNQWQKKLPDILTDIGTEAFHETLTEALYKYATEGEFDMNPYAATSGAASATGTKIGDGIGKLAFDVKTGPGGGPGNPPPVDTRGNPDGGPGEGSGNGPGAGVGNGSGPRNGPGNGFSDGPGNGSNNGLGNNVGDGPSGGNNAANTFGNGPATGLDAPRGLTNPGPGNQTPTWTDTIAGPNPQPVTTPSTTPPPVSPNTQAPAADGTTMPNQESVPTGDGAQMSPSQQMPNPDVSVPEPSVVSGQESPSLGQPNVQPPLGDGSQVTPGQQEGPGGRQTNPQDLTGLGQPIAQAPVENGSQVTPGQQEAPALDETSPQVSVPQPSVVSGQDVAGLGQPNVQPPVGDGSQVAPGQQELPGVDEASPQGSVPEPPVVSGQDLAGLAQPIPEGSVGDGSQVTPGQHEAPGLDEANPQGSVPQSPVVSGQDVAGLGQPNVQPQVADGSQVTPGQQTPGLGQANPEVSVPEPSVVSGQESPSLGQPNVQPPVGEGAQVTPGQEPPSVDQTSPQLPNPQGVDGTNQPTGPRPVPADGSGQPTNLGQDSKPQAVDPLTQQPMSPSQPEASTQQTPPVVGSQQPPVIGGQLGSSQPTTSTPSNQPVPTPQTPKPTPNPVDTTPKTTPNTVAPALPSTRPNTPTVQQAAATLGSATHTAPAEIHELVTNPSHRHSPVRATQTDKGPEGKAPGMQGGQPNSGTPGGQRPERTGDGPESHGVRSSERDIVPESTMPDGKGQQATSQQSKEPKEVGAESKGPESNREQSNGDQSKQPEVKDSPGKTSGGKGPGGKGEQGSQQGEVSPGENTGGKGPESNTGQSNQQSDGGQSKQPEVKDSPGKRPEGKGPERKGEQGGRQGEGSQGEQPGGKGPENKGRQGSRQGEGSQREQPAGKGPENKGEQGSRQGEGSQGKQPGGTVRKVKGEQGGRRGEGSQGEQPADTGPESKGEQGSRQGEGSQGEQPGGTGPEAKGEQSSRQDTSTPGTKPESKRPQDEGEQSGSQQDKGSQGSKPEGKGPQHKGQQSKTQQSKTQPDNGKQTQPQQSHSQPSHSQPSSSRPNHTEPIDTRRSESQRGRRDDNPDNNQTPGLGDSQRDTTADNVAAVLGAARAAHNQARSQLPAIARFVREAYGAVLGTTDAVARAQQRVDEARQHRTTLLTRRANLRQQRTNPAARNQIAAVEAAIIDATRAINRARADLAATQASHAAATNAHKVAVAAQNRARQAVDAAQAIQNRLGNGTVHRAIADDYRRAATDALTTVSKAKTAAKDAAKQGGVEKAITQLSSLPPGAELTIDTLGPLTDVADMLAGLTGATARSITAQLTDLGPDGLADAINRGTLDIDTPTGTVTVDLTADLHRPSDSRYAPPHTQPGTTSHDSSGENTNPLSSSTSSSLPLRIPVLFVSPIDAAGAAVRPMVYVGGVAKRAQKFDSGTTSSSSTSTQQTHVPTTMSITASRPDRPPVTASVQVGLNLPAITRTNVLTPNPVPAAAFTSLNPAPVKVPPSFVPVLGASAQVLHDTLLTPGNNPVQVDVNGATVTVTPTAPPTITLVGTTGVDQTHSTSHSNSWSTTRGSDATFGAGFYGGLKSWFLGAFTDFSTGATDGTNPATEHSTSHTAGNTELVYRIDRPMQVGNGVQDTVSSAVQVPVPLARSLGLALPPHLSGSQPVTVPGGNQPNVYWFGKDTITSVNTTAVVRGLSQGLGPTGQAAVSTKFGSQNSARDAIYNAMHGGDQVTWQEGGRTHFLDIYARPVPPRTTAPSALTEASAEDKHADQYRRTYDSKRSARVGVGGAHLYTGTDSPNPNPPKATPEAGLPNPYQGGPTTSGGLPRAAITGTWEGGYSNKSGYTGKDGRASKYDGDLRDFTGDVEFVTVHRSTTTPNWAQRFFFGDRQLFGASAQDRFSGPQKSDIDQAFAGNPHGRTDLNTIRVGNAIEVSTAADKLDWATRPLPNSSMNPGIYLGTPPPAAAAVDPAALGDYTNVEHVFVTPNTTEGVYIAMAKRVEVAPGSTPAPGPSTRVPPSGSGNWSTWGQQQFTESRTNPDGSPRIYTYKNSELTRPGTTSNDAVRDFVGQAGSRGTATQGIGGAPKTTGRMVQTGRLTDFNGELKATVEYSAPRLVDVRPNGVLKRNQAGDHVTGSTKSNAIGVDGEISLGYASKRDGRIGALLRGVFSGGWKSGTSHAVDMTSGTKHVYEYQGPTAFVALDARYTYEADMNIRNVVKTKPFSPLPVTVDQPNGVVVEMPVAHAIDLFNTMGIPVPPDLAGALPDPKTTVANPAQTLLTGDDYASYSDTTVVGAKLNGSLTNVETALDALGVTSKKWRADILGQVDRMLNSPSGHVWLKDVLVGGQGHGGVISVPNSNIGLEDVIDIRVTARPSNRAHTDPPARPIVPDKQSNADYVSTSVQDKKNTTWNAAAALEVGFNSREVPSVPPGQPDANGTVQQAQPNAGAAAGSFTPQVIGGSKAWKTDEVLPSSTSDKVNTQVDTDKVGRTSHEVDYQLTITRRRAPMPVFDTPLLGVPSQFDMDRTAPPVTLHGSVDLLSPSADVSPPLARPSTPPTFNVMYTQPTRPNPMFGPTGGWRVESIGANTAKAIHDALYAQLGGQKLTPGRMTQAQIDAAANTSSSYTRPGSNAEYVAHSMTKGSSLHSGGTAIFTGDKYHSENVVGGKNTLHDKLFDYGLTADFDPNSFRLVKALPEGTEMNLSQEHETGKPQGRTKTVSTSYGPSLPFFGGATANTGAAGPTMVGTGPPVSESITNDVNTTATSSKTGGTDGVKYTGRSYLFLANADFFSDVTRKGSNWTHAAVESVRDVFGGRPDRHTVVQIRSRDDLHVRVWEQEALDKGLITMADVWQHANKPAPDGFTVTPHSTGAILHPAGSPAPAPVGSSSPPGRSLHVGPGVGVADVRDFVATLPRDMRPTTYTVDPGSLLTPDDIHAAVDGLPEPRAAATVTNDDGGGESSSGTRNVGNGPAPEVGSLATIPEDLSYDSDDLYSAPPPKNKAPVVDVTSHAGSGPEASGSGQSKESAEAGVRSGKAAEVSGSGQLTGLPVGSGMRSGEASDRSGSGQSEGLPVGSGLRFDNVSEVSGSGQPTGSSVDSAGQSNTSPEGAGSQKPKGSVVPQPSESGSHKPTPELQGPPKQLRDPNTDQAWATQVADARDALSHLSPERQQQLLREASTIVSGGHQTVLFIERPTPEQAARQELLDQIRDVVMLDLHQNGPDSARETSRELGKDFGTTRTTGLPGGAPQNTSVGQVDVDLGEFLNLRMFEQDQPVATTTLAKANEFYAQLATATFDHPTDGPLPIPTEHPEDGCYIRAHLWAQQLREWGVDVKKVFIGRGGNDLVTQSANAFGATRDNPRPVTWRYHVAPLISIDLGNDGPPLEVVLDPAMGQGVVPVRKWLEMAGVTDGFDEADLYDAKPYPGYQGPLGPGETRLLITDAHAISPPWLDGDFPATFDQASDLVRSWHDRTRDYSIEATERRQFRNWHAALPDAARARFNTLNAAMDDAGRRDFHDWFRSLGRQERATFADSLGNDDTTVSDLVPAWEDRVRSARTHLGKLSADKYTEAKNAAELIVMMHHELPLDGGDRKALVDAITDVVAYRHHTEGYNKAYELSQRLAAEHGTALPPLGDTMDLDLTTWWTGLDNSLPSAPDGIEGLDFANLPVPWDTTDPADLSWLNVDPSDPTWLDVDSTAMTGFENATTAPAFDGDSFGPPEFIGPEPGSTDQLGAPVSDDTAGNTPPPDNPAADHIPAESGPGKRSRDEFEADGPSTGYEPPATRPVPEQLVPPSSSDVDALLDVVRPGQRFADPATFAPLVNGTRTELGRDVNCVDAALAFHQTWHGDPRVAGSAPHGPASGATAAAEELGYAPELVGRGAEGLAEVIERVTRGGHGSDALVFGFPRTGRGHAWNVVNHHGVISIVDSQAGTVRQADPGALDLDRVYAIPLDAGNQFITEQREPPAAPSSSDAYAVAEYERAVRVHEMRAAAAAGEEIPVPGGKLVPSLGGLRLVGAVVAAEIAADLAAVTGRDVVALVIGGDAEEPRPVRFTPTGRPLPV